MSINKRKIAEKEIHQTLSISNIFMRINGLSFIDDPPKTFLEKLKIYLAFGITSCWLFWMLVGEFTSLFIGSLSVEQLIRRYVHIAGYGAISYGKLIMVRYKNNAFRQLVRELPDIWPGPGLDEASAAIKHDSLRSLRIVQISYTCWNVFGVWMYNLTPIALYLYRLSQGETTALGFVYTLYYPFDQTRPGISTLMYIFEMFGGIFSVNAMITADILFITMASHISMLLRILQVNIRCIGMQKVPDSKIDYAMIVDVIKIHKRLISYGDDLENAFTVCNLLNVSLNSVNICCVMFSIVFLDPIMEVSNKLFIGAVITQVAVICWYADDIFRASAGVADAVYDSGWYRCDPRCRRALLVMLQRSQRPLYFTAMKFKSITMMTFSSIMTTSYSYFTLLYTSYSS